jgi:predicted nucleic acid-binding protein
MKLIDANVIIYSVGSDHSYRIPSILTMRRIRDGAIEGAISTEILQEVLHYYRHGRRLALGLQVFDDLVRQFPDPFPILPSTAKAARQLLERYPSIQARDAFHAAVVFENNLEGIISADTGLDVIAGLLRFDPKELAA